MLLTACFHIYGLNDVCLTNSCKAFHFCGISRTRLKIFNILSCLPVFGQFFGYYMIRKGVLFFKENQKNPSISYSFHKIEYSSMIVRGILSVLGLGVICLLMDIIIFFTTIIIAHI